MGKIKKEMQRERTAEMKIYRKKRTLWNLFSRSKINEPQTLVDSGGWKYRKIFC